LPTGFVLTEVSTNFDASNFFHRPIIFAALFSTDKVQYKIN